MATAYNIFDTSATKVEMIAASYNSSACVYGKYKLTIDLDGNGLTGGGSRIWQVLSLNAFKDHFKYISVKFYANSSRTELIEEIWIPTSDWTGSWYGPKVYTEARSRTGQSIFGTATTTSSRTLSLLRWGEQSSYTNYQFIYPERASQTIYVRFQALGHSTGFGNFNVNSFNRGNYQVGMDNPPAAGTYGTNYWNRTYDTTFTIPQRPEIVLEDRLVTGTNTLSHYATGVRLLSNDEAPRYQVNVDIDGGRSRDRLDNKINTGSNTAAYHLGLAFGYSEGNIQSGDYLRYKLRTMPNWSNYTDLTLQQFLAAIFSLTNEAAYTQTVAYIKPTLSFGKISYETDENGDPITMTRGTSFGQSDKVRYKPFIIDVIFRDNDNEVFADGEAGQEIVVGRYWGVIPHMSRLNVPHTPALAAQHDGIVIYAPDRYKFDNSECSAVLQTYEYTHSYDNNPIQTSANCKFLAKAQNLAYTIPEEAIENVNVLQQYAHKITATFQGSHEAAANSQTITDTNSGAIVGTTLVNFPIVDVSERIQDFWDDQVLNVLFVAYDQDDVELDSTLIQPTINSSEHFRFKFSEFTFQGYLESPVAGFFQKATSNTIAPLGTVTDTHTNFPVTVNRIWFDDHYSNTTNPGRAIMWTWKITNAIGIIIAEGDRQQWNSDGELWTGNMNYGLPSPVGLPANFNLYTDGGGLIASAFDLRLYAYSNENKTSLLDSISYPIHYDTYRRWQWDTNNPDDMAVFDFDRVHDVGSTGTSGSYYQQRGISILANAAVSCAHSFNIVLEGVNTNGSFAKSVRIPGSHNPQSYGNSLYVYDYNVPEGLITDAEMKQYFPDIYKDKDYKINWSIAAEDNLGNSFTTINSTYNLSARNGLQPVDLVDGTKNKIELTESSSGRKGTDKRYLKAYWDVGAVGAGIDEFAHALAVKVYYLTPNFSVNNYKYLWAGGIDEAAGGNYDTYSRIHFIEASSYNDYRSKVDNGVGFEKFYLSDIAGTTYTAGNVTTIDLRPVLEVYSNAGRLLDSDQGLDLDDVGYTWSKRSSTASIFGQGEHEIDYNQSKHNIKFNIGSTQGSRWDYAFLDIKETWSGNNDQLTFELPRNGNNSYIAGNNDIQTFTNDVNGQDLNIYSLLKGKFGTSQLQWNLHVYGYGMSTSNSTPREANDIIGFETSTFSVVGLGWDWGLTQNQVLAVSHNYEATTLTLQISSTPSQDSADRFILRLYINGSNSDVSFTLQGQYHTGGNMIFRSTDINGLPLDITSHVTDRWDNNNSLTWTITAYDDTTDPFPEGNSLGTFTGGTVQMPSLDWNWNVTSADISLMQDSFPNLKFGLTARRLNTSDVCGDIRVVVNTKVLDGDTLTFAEMNNRGWDNVIDTQISKFQRSGTNSTASEMEHLIEIPITDSDLDLYKIQKFHFNAEARKPNGSGGFERMTPSRPTNLDSSLTTWKPYWDLLGGTTTITTIFNTIHHKMIDIEIVKGNRDSTTDARGTGDSQFCGNFILSLTRTDKDITKSYEITGATTGSVGPTGVDIKDLFNDGMLAGDDDIKIDWELYYTRNGADSHTKTGIFFTRGEPTLSLTRHADQTLLAKNGSQIIGIKYKVASPDDTIYPSYFANTSVYIVRIEKKNENGSWVLVKEISHSPSDFDQYKYAQFTIANSTDEFGKNHDVRIRAQYTLTRFQDGTDKTNSGPWTTMEIPNIYNRFPEVNNSLSTMIHGFDNNGDPALLMSFQKNSKTGNDTGYGFDMSVDYSISATGTEIVTNAITENAVDTTKTINFNENSFSQSQTNDGFTSLPFPAEINEALYTSNVSVEVTETYTNNPDLVQGINDNTIESQYVQTKTYTKSDLAMNDVSQNLNYGIMPVEGTISNISPSNYGLSGKRIKFKNNTDFNNYYINSTPKLMFGLQIEYTKNSTLTTTDGVVITRNGDLIAESSLDVPEKARLAKNASIYKIAGNGDLPMLDGEFYYFDFDISYSNSHGWSTSPDLSSDFTYKLISYSEEEVLLYNDTNITAAAATLEDLSTWGSIVLTPTEDVKSRIESYEFTPPGVSDLSITANETVGSVEGSFGIGENKSQYPFSNSVLRSYAFLKFFQNPTIENNSVQSYGTELIETFHSVSTSNGGKSASFSFSGDLNIDGFDPTKEIYISINPASETRTSVGGSQVDTAKKKSTVDEFISVDYSSRIVPSFDNLSKDDSLNEDNTVENSQTANNTVFWIYNKNELEGLQQVFTTSEEWVKVIRKIRQGENLVEGANLSPVYLKLFSSDVTRTSHSDTENKFSYIDDNINVTPYSTNGILTDRPYAYVYEITPVFKYQASNSNSATLVEVPSKTVSTFIKPDKFPISLNSIFDISHFYNEKHSIDVRWKYRNDQNMITLSSIGGSVVNFEIYTFIDETEDHKQLSPRFKPTMNTIQSRKSTWNYIGKTPYSFPEDDEAVTEHRFLIDYDKLESTYNLRVAVIVTIESEMFSNLSQLIGSAGASNSFSVDVDPSDFSKVNNIFMPPEMDLTSMKHEKNSEQYVKLNNLSQVPFSVTRKKAKTRLSKKPYTSST